jgi:hypothetical protein
LNGGRCDDLMLDYRCTCPLGFTGRRCEIETMVPTCLGDDRFTMQGTCLLRTVCGKSIPAAFGGGDCSYNTAEFADWWCQLGGYSRAVSYTTLSSGAEDSLYYAGGNAEVLSVCTQVTGPSAYGFNSDCTGVKDLECEPNPVSSALRPTLMSCGMTNRDLTTFVPPGVMMRLAYDCRPDSSTQALLVPRYGEPSLAQANLREYLHQGGIVITEYSVSDEVWSRVFPPVSQSNALRGSCTDNVPTVVQYSPNDPFWLDNEWDPIPASETGCGYSVRDFPYLTPLAGWDQGTVALGYRNVGMGRFWAADFDWQDADQNNADLARLMSYMVTHRR